MQCVDVFSLLRYAVGIGVSSYLITSAEIIAAENEVRGLGTKNGSYRKVPKDLASRSGGLTFHKFYKFLL